MVDQVRCDGNKASCKRCIDKRLTCIYSESRVGKVVGKRRKRPVDDSIGTVDSDAWVVNQQHPYSIPSPTTTSRSSAEPTSKRQCLESSWTYFLDDDHSYQEGSEASEALESIEMVRSRSQSVANEVAYYSNAGLVTPSLSPPLPCRSYSPAPFGPQIMARQSSMRSIVSHRQLDHIAPSRPLSRASSQQEDEETVCIKLLAHLKKYSASSRLGRGFQLDLLTKSNASIRRILRSQNLRNDHSCQFLLTSIMTHLAVLCENLCSTAQDRARSETQTIAPPTHAESFDMRTGLVQCQTSSETLRPLVLETCSLNTEVGNLLKRQPLDGFQIFGKWETYTIELALRLEEALVTLR